MSGLLGQNCSERELSMALVRPEPGPGSDPRPYHNQEKEVVYVRTTIKRRPYHDPSIKKNLLFSHFVNRSLLRSYGITLIGSRSKVGSFEREFYHGTSDTDHE